MNLQTIEISNLIKFTSALIEFDNERLIELARAETTKYNNLIVVEEQLPAIKKDIAYLNSLIKTLDDERKKVKKTYNEPLSEFENKIKQVTEIINTTANMLKTQADKFEEARKLKKKTQIVELINNLILTVELKDKFKQAIVFQDRWLNSTVSMKEINETLQTQITQLKQYQDDEAKAEALRIENERIKKEAEDERLKNVLSLIDVLNNANSMDVKGSQIRDLTRDGVIAHFDGLVKAKYVADSREKQQPLETISDFTTPAHIAKCYEPINEFVIKLTGIDKDSFEHICTRLKEAYKTIQITKLN